MRSRDQDLRRVSVGLIVPLTEQLANTLFRSDLDRLWTKGALKLDKEAPVGLDLPVCRCGCGQSLSRGRKFANQGHYNTWRAEHRRNSKKRPMEAATPAKDWPGIVRAREQLKRALKA